MSFKEDLMSHKQIKFLKIDQPCYVFFSLSRVKEVEMLCGIRVGSGQTREVSHLPSESVRFRIQAQNIEIIWQDCLELFHVLSFISVVMFII